MTHKSTSWGNNSKWYNKIVGDSGHYYHQHIVIPTALRLLDLSSDSHLLDIGCGQGVLARAIPPQVNYVGIDISPELIKQASLIDKNPKHRYMVADVTKPITIKEQHTSHVAIILAIQNMAEITGLFHQIGTVLKSGGKFVLVLNHPCFRIPRQSGWDINEQQKTQKRWVNRYMTPLEIPITMHPGSQNSTITWSYHRPLSYYVELLRASGFRIDTIDEMVSDKESVGRASKMENRSRSDIPLFMAIRAIKP